MLAALFSGVVFAVTMVVGFLMSNHGSLLISLITLLLALGLGLVHVVLAGTVHCPLCRGAVLASRRCSRHRRTFRLMGSYRLGVAIPVLLFMRFRCPYCGELCSCAERGDRPADAR